MKKTLSAVLAVGTTLTLTSCSVDEGGFPSPEQAVDEVISVLDNVGDKVDNATGQGQGGASAEFTGENAEQLPSTKDSALQGTIVPADVSHENTDTSGDYVKFYRVVSDAVIQKQVRPQEVQYGELDSLGRSTGVWAMVTADMFEHSAGARLEREPGKEPSGYKGNNDKVIITYTPPGYTPLAYKGYFYNRSHLLGDLVGGRFFVNNLVTGTRMQNVGWNKASGAEPGGMQYTETLASDHFKKLKKENESLPDGQKKQCNVYYSAVPNYVGDELVPRTVTVDIRSCDKSIDERVIVDNTAPGYTVDYNTGKFTAVP